MANRHILECVGYETDEVGYKTPIRKMYGLTMDFGAAHYFMERYFKHKFDAVIIHPLNSIDDFVELLIVDGSVPAVDDTQKKGET